MFWSFWRFSSKCCVPVRQGCLLSSVGYVVAQDRQGMRSPETILLVTLTSDEVLIVMFEPVFISLFCYCAKANGPRQWATDCDQWNRPCWCGIPSLSRQDWGGYHHMALDWLHLSRGTWYLCNQCGAPILFYTSAGILVSWRRVPNIPSLPQITGLVRRSL
jgi:hypothetical protein